MIVDSGTSLMVIPKAEADALGWTGKETIIDCSKASTLPTLSFTIGGDVYELTGEEYILNVEG